MNMENMNAVPNPNPTPTPPPDMMTQEMEVCWRNYQRMKESADRIKQREGVAPELAEAAHQAAYQRFKDCVYKVMLKYNVEEVPFAHAAGSTQGGHAQSAQQAGNQTSTNWCMGMGNRTLYRTERDKMVAGVCGGIAEYFEVDAALVRVGFVLGTLFLLPFGGTGLLILLVYVVLAILLPLKSEVAPHPTMQTAQQPQQPTYAPNYQQPYQGTPQQPYQATPQQPQQPGYNPTVPPTNPTPPVV